MEKNQLILTTSSIKTLDISNHHSLTCIIHLLVIRNTTEPKAVNAQLLATPTSIPTNHTHPPSG